MAQILMLTPQLPFPPHQGTSLRNFHILQALSANHDVSLLSFDESEGRTDLEKLRSLSTVLPPVPVPTRTNGQRIAQLLTTTQPDMAQRLNSDDFSGAILRALSDFQFDAVQIEGIELAPYLFHIRRIKPDLPIVLDCHNAETELQRRTFRNDLKQPPRWPVAAYSWIQSGRLARFERESCLQADKLIAVSEADRDHLNDLIGVGVKPITVIPNSIEWTDYNWQGPISPDQCFDVLFTGKMDYRPNVDGVAWFAESVWPLIRARDPKVTWGIVGQKPHTSLKKYENLPGITITGRVDHIQPYLAGAKVYVLPLRVGSGTRLKLIEAMAAGKAIVSTTSGAEGYPVQDGKDLLLADDPAQMADKIVDLLANPKKREALGNSARGFAQAFDWRGMIGPLASLYEDLLGV